MMRDIFGRVLPPLPGRAAFCRLTGGSSPRVQAKNEYFRGNLAGEDFGIITFNQPLVQWCPVPIVSASTGTIFNKKEPWGLTTDNFIVLSAKLRKVIDRAVSGLEAHDSTIYGDFHSYSIRETGVHVPEDVDYTHQPLIIDGRNLTFPNCDIWRCENGAIVCTNRLAAYLNNFWDGLPDVKFQPINCKNIDPAVARMFEEPLDHVVIGVRPRLSRRPKTSH